MQTMLIVIAAVSAAFALLSAAAGLFLCIFATSRRRSYDESPEHFPRHAERIREGQAWLDAQKTERVELTASDGVPLVGFLLRAEGKPRGAMLLMHGYRSSFRIDFAWSVRTLHEMGYDLLLVYQRACGESGGRHITYGVRERYDCRDWARLLAEREPDSTPIFLYGLSLGCTTVLLASALGLPETVRGIVADCGFTSPHDEFVWLIQHGRYVPFWRLAYAFSRLFARLFAGFGFRECSTLDAMAANRLPVIFFHGGRDRFVPTVFSIRNYLACTAEKELVIVSGATHGVSWLTDEALYTAKLRAFLERYGSDEDRS